MDGEEIIFSLLVAFYVFCFLLFARYFWWRRFAYHEYWGKRPALTTESLEGLAREKGRKVPFISIMVPARGEAMVIANTIRHLIALDYPSDRMEIMVITDAKEERSWLQGEQREMTTMQAVENLLTEITCENQPFKVRHVTVPVDFDGRMGGSCTGADVPSTKGRALNYGMGFLHPETEICAFYDAESRPEKTVLLYVAYRYLTSDCKEQEWYGPVFQVRNFFQQGIISRIGALFQCISHEWYIPVLMRRLPFVGGTNFFAASKLLKKVGGYDFTTLTEDVEFGVRAYLLTGQWPVYIPYWSTEQTPASYKAFFRQRLRWGSGHLQITDKFHRACGFYPEKRRKKMVFNLYLKGEAEWLFFQGALFFNIAIMIGMFLGALEFSKMPFALLVMLRLFLVTYYVFLYFLFSRYKKLMDYPHGKGAALKLIAPYIQFLLLPAVSPFLLLPYSWALVLKFLHREPRVWVKTPRTAETGSKIGY